MATVQNNFTRNETLYLDAIAAKSLALRALCEKSQLSADKDVCQWFTHLSKVKHILGNIGNDLSFVASLLAKQYLINRFGPMEFDAGLKPQGAAGIDIAVVTTSGLRIEGEIKTTVPYQPGFGAQQKKEITKDMIRLAASNAEFRFMFLTNADAVASMKSRSFDQFRNRVEIVNLCDW